MKNILITGSSGFVGSNIIDLFKGRYNIYATSRKKKYSNRKLLKFIYYKDHLELSKRLKRIKINTVIHCATHYVKKHSLEDISKITKANIEFSAVISENLAVMNVKKFINFCTVWQNYNGKFKNPYNLYSASKNSFVEILKYYKKKYKKINFFNLYLSDTYGNNDKRKKLISTLKNDFHKSKKINIESKKLSVNLLNVKDIISAVEVIINKNVKNGDYNVINDSNFKIKNIIFELKKQKKFALNVRWGKRKNIYNKIYKQKKLPLWEPKNSSFKDLINFILRQS